MPALVENGYRIFTDVDGDPLEDGYIYIGEAGLNPLASPLQAYWDSDLTVPASSIRTRGGYPSNSGNPGRLYTPANYSILVKDKKGATVYTLLDSVDYYNAPSGNVIQTVETIAELRLLNPNVHDYYVSVGGYYTVGDVSDIPIYRWDSVSTATDNGGSVIQVTGVPTGRWLWGELSSVKVEWFGAAGDWDNDTKTGTDDTEAIQKVITYMRNLHKQDSSFVNKVKPRTVLSDGKSYRITDTLDIFKQDFIVNGTIIYDGLADRPALIIGLSGDFSSGFEYRIDIKSTSTDKSDDDFIGVKTINIIHSKFDIVHVYGFTTNIKIESDLLGNSWNQYNLGLIQMYKYGIWFDAINSGYISVNNFFGGTFLGGTTAAEQAIAAAIPKISIRYESSDDTGNPHYSNNWYGTDIEVGGASLNALDEPIRLVSCVNNNFNDFHMEAASNLLAINQHNSMRNRFDISIDTSNSSTLIKTTGLFSSNTKEGQLQEITRINFIEDFNYYKSNKVYLKSMDWTAFAGSTDYLSSNGLDSLSVIDYDTRSVTLSLSAYPSIYLTTDEVQKFRIETGNNPVVIICYDSGGSILSGSSIPALEADPDWGYGQYARDNNRANPMTTNSGYGGGYKMNAVSNLRFPLEFEVHPDVKKIKIVLQAGEWRSLIISAMFDYSYQGTHYTPIAYKEYRNTGKTTEGVPTYGTWERGEVVVDLLATTSIGHKCTVSGDFAGTPPTFIAI